MNRTHFTVLTTSLIVRSLSDLDPSPPLLEIVFEAMYLAGDLNKPGKGIMYMSELDKVATYIPDAVLENIK